MTQFEEKPIWEIKYEITSVDEKQTTCLAAWNVDEAFETAKQILKEFFRGDFIILGISRTNNYIFVPTQKKGGEQ